MEDEEELAKETEETSKEVIRKPRSFFVCLFFNVVEGQRMLLIRQINRLMTELLIGFNIMRLLVTWTRAFLVEWIGNSNLVYRVRTKI